MPFLISYYLRRGSKPRERQTDVGVSRVVVQCLSDTLATAERKGRETLSQSSIASFLSAKKHRGALSLFLRSIRSRIASDTVKSWSRSASRFCGNLKTIESTDRLPCACVAAFAKSNASLRLSSMGAKRLGSRYSSAQPIPTPAAHKSSSYSRFEAIFICAALLSVAQRYSSIWDLVRGSVL